MLCVSSCDFLTIFVVTLYLVPGIGQADMFETGIVVVRDSRERVREEVGGEQYNIMLAALNKLKLGEGGSHDERRTTSR